MFRLKPRLNRPQLLTDYYDQPEEPDCLYRSNFVHPRDASDCEGCRDRAVSRHARYLRNPPEEVKDVPFIKSRADGFSDYPNVYYGSVASADALVKSALERNTIYHLIKTQRKADALCFEMEAAGIVTSWPCLVIRGICDYSDSHKNNKWQNFAAATAAAYFKDLILSIPSEAVDNAPRVNKIISEVGYNAFLERYCQTL